MLINVKIKNDVTELIKRYKAGFAFVRAKVLQATLNEVIKYSLPSNQHSKGTAKQQAKGYDYNKVSASKVSGAIKRNLKRLQQRIKKNILGDGKLPSAHPTPKTGKIIKGTLDGELTGGAFVVMKQQKKNKNKKKRKNAKKYNKPPYFAENAKTLIEHIKNNTYLKGGKKAAVRKWRKGIKYIWLKNEKIARDAANHFIYMSGYLLSGWTAAQNAVGRFKALAMGSRVNHLKSILNAVKLRRTNPGIATIRESEDETGLAAINPNVANQVLPYQQKMVNEVLAFNMKKHF